MLGVTLTVLLVIAALAFADDPHIADTTGGKVQGFISSSRSGRNYISFLGIPFAKPPVGSLRFQPPVEAEPWSGVRNATDDHTICIQTNNYLPHPKVIGQEDCLYLNVFTHDMKGSAPTMVHIHGGGYIIGDKSDHGPQYLMDENVVVVDINFRVGIMGFLSFEYSAMPGNQGLKDQNLALRWVVDNIANFGGDPARIILIGESAGSGCVWHHIISPKSKGLIQGAIAESGTAYNLISTLAPGLPKKRAAKLADLTSCTKDTTEETVSCLQGMDAQELVNTLPQFREWQVDPLLLFAPVLEAPSEDAFVTGPVSSWDTAPIPVLMGTNSAEGLFRTTKYLVFDSDFEWFNEHFDELAPLSLRYGASTTTPDEVTKKIKEFYFNYREITAADWVNFTNAYGDALFTHGIYTGADKHTGDVYFYYFDYLGEFTYGPKNRTLAIGAAHYDETIYIWQTKGFSPLNEQDLELSKKIVQIWTDFAKNGKATSPNEHEPWEKWTAEHHNYLHISKDGFKAGQGLNEERYKFWNELNYRDKFP